MKLSVVLLLIIGLSSSQLVFAQENNVSKEHAAQFGKLLVQNKEGRIHPINTAATNFLLKVHKKTNYNGLSAEQVYLGVAIDSKKWMSEKIIKVRNTRIQKLIGIDSDYASISDFLDESGKYKIQEQVEKAYIKKPATRNNFDKDIINVDERANVYYMGINGTILSIFPLVDDPNNKWVSPSEFHQKMGHGTKEGDYFENYKTSLIEALNSGDYQKANKALAEISAYQIKEGSDIMPSESKVKMEIFYNKAELFSRIFPYYMIIGFIMIALFFWQTFFPSYEFKTINKVLAGVLLLGFAIHTLGLGLRWYISGHAPWSNGYESMIYISWATILAGFLFMKKSPIILGVSAMLAGITLFTAHMSWLNPEITNLVPVLKSYWLTIHVATITASYGFLGLGCMLALLNLCILIFRNKSNRERIDLTLNELTLIVEMMLIVGLVLLIIGNFLGGIWANESWGRYWGWDPKETWTLVTIILYSFTLHTSLIPKFRSIFTFNFLAMVSFGAILMTYFGVNYFLSGLHSYAEGDPVEIPNFVYYALAILFSISSIALYRTYHLNKSLIAESVE